jgi:hypothetical protein
MPAAAATAYLSDSLCSRRMRSASLRARWGLPARRASSGLSTVSTRRACSRSISAIIGASSRFYGGLQRKGSGLAWQVGVVRDAFPLGVGERLVARQGV